MTPDTPTTGWPRGRWGWIAGTVVLLVLGVVVGLVIGSVWLGLTLAVIVSIGWLIAYESWRGRTPGLDDPWDDGAQL
ncbi:hypothetical protein [Microbacterium dextranolyticum]|uniref:Uncharacterized protein n=1 Tax=Microbacterium dextranolyticum TaxID=36806 RepID=A0A9W6HL67_9MICO|nr:hypothetical protein [Microbacterium dextranolyticum]MBM7463998.1 hypothetical protein [Microbacterium dextranolyticum]GLJ95078.1 hypothetical protein GCM10017591_11400 [Microbacterium dextranolyticum]